MLKKSRRVPTTYIKCKGFVLKVATGRYRAGTQGKEEPIHIIGIDIGSPETSSTTYYIDLISPAPEMDIFFIYFTASPYLPHCAQLAATSSLP